MKTKIKRHSRAVISVILAISMLISCMMVGLIATDAAKVTGDEAVGDTTYYLLCSFNQQDPANWSSNGSYATSSDYSFSITPSSFNQTSWANITNYYVGVSSSNTYTGMYGQNGTVTVTKGTGMNSAEAQTHGNYHFMRFTPSVTGSETIYVNCTVNGTTVTYDISTTSSGGGSGGDDPTPSGGIGTEVTDDSLLKILNGTDVSFYIESYTDKEWAHLSNDSKQKPTYTRHNKIGTRWGKAYLQIAKTSLSTYPKITNNVGDWAGDSNSAITNTNPYPAGMHLVKNGNDNVSAVGSTTTINSSYRNTDTMSISTRSDATKTAFTENSSKVFNMTLKYYIKSGTKYYHLDGKDISASTTAKTTSYSLENLSAGNYTLITLAVDSEDYVRYIADTDVFTVTTENKYTVNISAGTGGSVSPNGDQSVGVNTGLSVTATPSTGYSFSSWTKTNVTTTDDNATTTVKPTDSNVTHSLVANFTPNNYKVSYSSAANGTFTVTKTSDSSAIASGASVPYNTGITVTCSPNTGYQLSSVKYTNASGTAVNATVSGNTATFSVPAANTTITVTFAGKPNTITTSANPGGGGTVWVASSASSSTALNTYNTGATVYLRATPAAAYNFSKFIVTYANGITQEVTTNNSALTIDATHFNGSDGSITVAGYFTKKPTHKVTVVSNNNALGTATASVTEAYEGQQVTLISREDTGSFSSWSVTSGGVSVSNNKFTMSSSDVAITATFVAYSGNSNFYYNSYGSNGQPAATNYGARMTEAKIGGQTYSYYHVTGRTESDQLFTVSYESPKYDSYNCFFEIGDNWNGDPQVQFYATDGKNLGDWATMNWVDFTTGHKKFSYPIPDGARSVRFKHGGTETAELYFTSGYNGWYTNGSMSSLTGYSQSNPVETNFWENFHSTKYTDAFDSKGFDNHNASRGESHAYIKPKDLGSFSSDYYVLVLYKGKTYTINGVTTKISNDPEIIWLPELPDSGDTIKVYAKDGAIRDGLNTFANIADTTVYKADGTTSAGAASYGSGQTYEVYKAQRGETIVVKTTIADTTCTGATDTYRDRYYVRGFCVNGEVPQILSPNNDGVYTLTYTVPEEYEGKYIEITPIYYLKDTTKYPVVTFRATDFPKNQYNWGNVPYCYPFYGSLSDKDNAFGAYPGQPLVFYKGQYSMQVPVKSTSPFSVDGVNTNVAGITMSNGYYDSIHKMIMGYGDDSASADHVQTYDYGDFWKIFNEKKPVDNIVFDFKYRTQKHNLIDDTTGDDIAVSTLTGKYTNGFELLKNFHGRNVDLFGTPLSGDSADPSKTPAVYVVSIGGINDGSSGVENIAGFYATEWRVYAPNDMTSTSTTYKKMSAGNKSSIPPEVLVLNDDDDASFNTSTYPSAVYKTGKYYKITDWKALYQALEDYRGLPVYISYEAADAQNGAEDYQTGTHGATRNDGRWLYSKNGESITSRIRVDVSQDNGATYNPNDELQNPVTGIDAYFTNTEAYGTKTYATTIDPDKTFNFEAKTTNGEYKFVGWYLDDSNKTLITNDNAGSTERSGSYTFVARFMHVTSGQLILSHTVATDDTYKGTGSVTIAAVVKDAEGNTKKTYAASSNDITLDDSIVKSDSTDTVEVTLTATRGENSPFGLTSLDTPSDQDNKFFDYGTYTVSADGYTRTFNFAFSIADLFTGDSQTFKNLIYHSYFDQFTFNYSFKFEVPTRDGSIKYYYRNGTLNAKQVEAYVYKVYNANTKINDRYLKKEFVDSIAPFESNFGTSIEWNTDNYLFHANNNVYNINTQFVNATQTGNVKADVTFNLPYRHNNGVAVLLSNGEGQADTVPNFELTGDNAVEFGTIPELLGTDVNGIFTEAGKTKWIAAPAKLDNGQYFRYWSIKTTDNNIEVARCYFQGFNYLAYGNYEITPIYGNAPDSITTSDIYSGASYLETSRNQWNSLDNSSGTTAAA